MSLLAQAAKEANQARKTRNTVIQVQRFELNAQGGIRDQVMVGVDISTNEVLKIVLGDAPTETAAAQRTTIPQLQTMEKRRVEVGGYVRVDGLRPSQGGLMEAKFVKTIKGSMEDSRRHFIKMKARAYESKKYETQQYGQTVTNQYARIEVMDDSNPITVRTGAEFQETVVRLLAEGTKCTNGIGDNTVFLRDDALSKTYSLRAKSIKNEAGQYRKPNVEELHHQVKSMDLVKIISSSLDQHNGEASIDLIPGCTLPVVGKTASSKGYNLQAEKFYKGNFKQLDANTGEIVERPAVGFRDSIVGFTRLDKPDGTHMWCVSSLASTLVDELTLNGLKESARVWNNPEQAIQNKSTQSVQDSTQNHSLGQQQGLTQETNQQQAQQNSPQRVQENSQQPGQPQSQQPSQEYIQQPSQQQSTQQYNEQPLVEQTQRTQQYTHDDSFTSNEIEESGPSLDDLLEHDELMDDDIVDRAVVAFNEMNP